MNDLLLNFAATLILLPGPILPTAADVSALFSASTSPVEQRNAEPVRASDIDALLALPSGFRAPGFQALSFTRTAGN